MAFPPTGLAAIAARLLALRDLHFRACSSMVLDLQGAGEWLGRPTRLALASRERVDLRLRPAMAADLKVLAVNSCILPPVLAATAGGFPVLRRLVYGFCNYSDAIVNLWAWGTPALTLPALEVFEAWDDWFTEWTMEASPGGGVERWAAALVGVPAPAGPPGAGLNEPE